MISFSSKVLVHRGQFFLTGGLFNVFSVLLQRVLHDSPKLFDVFLPQQNMNTEELATSIYSKNAFKRQNIRIESNLKYGPLVSYNSLG